MIEREKEEIKLLADPKKDHAQRARLRMQAQEWAGLEVNPDADLFIFAGRWSQQKGVDLIADLFPTILEKHQNVQLICVGPVIGKFGVILWRSRGQDHP